MPWRYYSTCLGYRDRGTVSFVIMRPVVSRFFAVAGLTWVVYVFVLYIGLYLFIGWLFLSN